MHGFCYTIFQVRDPVEVDTIFETEAREITKLGKEIQKIIPGRMKVTWIKSEKIRPEEEEVS